MAGTSKTNKRTPQTTIIKVGANEMGKLPPQAPELEDSVLGALMLEKEAYGTVADLLRPEVWHPRRTCVITPKWWRRKLPPATSSPWRHR